jgi:hypothetical protein
MRWALAIPLVLLLSACAPDRSQAQVRHRQATIDVAAGIYEAAVALENGSPQGLTIQAIKIAAMTIIQTQGGSWPRGERWLEHLRQRPQGDAK